MDSYLIVFIFADGRFRGNNKNYKRGTKQRSVPNAHVRSEIKDLEQVRKERQQKANKIAQMKSKPKKKGRKMGKGGKRGKSK